jgi:hypothetical protein
VAEDPLAEALRLLEQAGLRRAYAAGVGGVVGPVVRPLTGGPLLAAWMDAGIDELRQRVIALAEARVSVQLSARVGVHVPKPGVSVQGEVAHVIVRALPGEVIIGTDETPKAAGSSLITAQRLLNILICLIAVMLLQTYAGLSSKDQNLLMGAIAIGGLAWQASDHVRPGK